MTIRNAYTSTGSPSELTCHLFPLHRFLINYTVSTTTSMKDGSDNSIDSRHNVAAESEAKREDAKMPDTLPDHSQAAAAELAAMSPEEYAAFEKKLMWKLDLKIIPWIT